jgi:hypothetical protein
MGTNGEQLVALQSWMQEPPLHFRTMDRLFLRCSLPFGFCLFGSRCVVTEPLLQRPGQEYLEAEENEEGGSRRYDIGIPSAIETDR